MPALTFAAVGDNCIDKFRPSGASLVGGNALNVAVQLRRLGETVAYFGAVGQDADGRRTIDELLRNGVDVQNLQTLPTVTAYTDIAVDASGDRAILFEEFGACRQYRPSPTDLERIRGARHVHIGWLDDAGALRRDLAKRGVSVSQDITVNADPASLQVAGLDVAFGSSGQDLDRAGQMARSLFEQGAKLAVVTCGALGSVAWNGSEIAKTGIRPVEVFDTTGAGDSFIAGFLSALVRGLHLQACLEAGRDAAAITCTHFGGFPQMEATYATKEGTS